jgi:hypothetical protein
MQDEFDMYLYSQNNTFIGSRRMGSGCCGDLFVFGLDASTFGQILHVIAFGLCFARRLCSTFVRQSSKTNAPHPQAECKITLFFTSISHDVC